MKLKILLFGMCFVILLLFSVSAEAGDIGLIENETWQQNLTGSLYSNAAVLGDIDNDGDLDLIEIGCSGGSGVVCTTADKSRVYINNGTSFVENATWQVNLTSIGYGSIAFGDIDNDGDLDLVLSQTSSSRIYTNNGTSFVENSTWQEAIIPEEGGSQSVLLGDIDNDGDLDLVFSGMGGTLNNTFLYDGTTFIGDPSWSQMTEEGKVSSFLADLDNDNDLDLTIMGIDSAKSYINNGSSLVYDANWNVLDGDENSIVAGDIDNDGDMDIVEIGSGGICDDAGNILLNNGSQFVREVWNMTWNQDMGCFPFGCLAFGDYDNNGYLDLASIGGNDREIFSNNGTAFTENATAEANVTGEHYSSAVWGDVDNDGDLDLIIIRSQKVYINNNTNPNTVPNPPSPPANNYSYSNREITLIWNNGSDSETGNTGLYYNLRIGTSSGGNQIISGVYGGYGDQTGGGTTGGYFGNMMQRKNITLKADRFLPDTTYYWSVQTIDTALANGSWSTEESFNTPLDMGRPTITMNSPDDSNVSGSYNITFNITVSDNLNVTNVSLWGSWGNGWGIKQTNSTGENNTDYIFKEYIPRQNTFTWAVQACDNETNCALTGNRTFTISTVIGLIENETWQGNLTNVRWSSHAWGDIDKDSDLDLILTGDCTSNNCCQNSNTANGDMCAEIYVNNGTTLVYNSTYSQNLTGASYGSVSWGDIDNDNDLDLVITGSTDGNNAGPTRIYINNGTSLVENSTWEQNLTLSETYYGSVVFGDINNNGLLDLVTCCSDTPRIYINNGTTLIENSTWEQSLSIHSKSQTFLVDLDQDSDLDLIVVGTYYTSGTKVYINNGTNFVENSIWKGDLGGTDEGASAMGDIGNDGDLDIIISAVDGSDIELYFNNETTFMVNQTEDDGLSIVSFGSHTFGDYDNDGDLDLATIGLLGGNSKKYIWDNNNTVFIEDTTAQANLTPASRGDITWADIDNDGDLDLIYTYADNSDTTRVYINNNTNPNTAPNPPSSPANNYSYSNREITLIWNNGSDSETGNTGLYYNLRVGTSSGGNQIVSGVYGGSSNPTAGYFGNMMQRKNITLKVDRFLPDTTYYWSVQTIDTALANGSWSTEESFKTSLDMGRPTVTLNAPADWYNSSSSSVTFNATVWDSYNVTNVTLWGNFSGSWAVNETNSTNENDTDYIFTKTLLDGEYIWAVEVWDNESNWVITGNRTLTVDTTAPSGVGFVDQTPANDTNLSQDNYLINVSFTELHLDTCLLELSNTSGIVNYTMTRNNQTSCFFNVAGQSDYREYFYVYVNDTAGNLGKSGIRHVTIDTTVPHNLTYTSPSDDYNSSSNTVEFNFTVWDNLENSMGCALYINDVVNSSLIGVNNNSLTDQAGWTLWLADGEYVWNVTCNDSAGNTNTTAGNWTVTVDTTKPSNITYTFPPDNYNSSSNTVEFNFTVWDNLENSMGCTLYIDDVANSSRIGVSNNTETNFTLWLADGMYVWNVTCNDSAGNTNTTAGNRTVTVDTIPISKVNFVDPTPNESQNMTYIYVNISLSETPSSCLLEWDDGTLDNETMTRAGSGSDSICYRNMTGLMVFNYTFSVYANDSAGNWNSSEEREIEVYTGAPAVNITSPEHNTWKNVSSVTFNYSVTGSSLDSCSLYINISGWEANQTNTSLVSEAQDNFSVGFPDGDYIWNIMCNDTTGNTSWYPSNLTLHIDTTNPDVAIVSPGNRTYSQNPELNFSCSEANPDSCWYWNGTGNISLASCNTNGTSIPGSEGQNLVILYMNDSAGNMGSDSLYWSLDTVKPLITLISPGNASSWSSSGTVAFRYNVSDAGIANCSLIVDGSLDQTDTSVSVNTTQAFTKSLSNGNYVWQVNCTDLGGLENSSLIWNLTVSYSPPSQDTGNGGGGGDVTISPVLPSATKTWDKIEPGVEAKMVIDREGLDFTEISIEVENRMNNVEITVKKLAKQPATITKNVTGKVYQYVEIIPKNINETMINKSAIKFRVNNSWISGNHIDMNKVYLYRYAGNQWNKLTTTYVSRDENYTYYEAESPGFSTFAVAGEKVAGVCTAEEKRCSGNDLEQCSSNGTAWEKLETCSYGCNETTLACNTKPAGALCIPGEKRCLDNQLQQCSSDGMEWSEIKTCVYGCNETTLACDPKPGVSEAAAEMPYWVWYVIVIVIIAAGFCWKYKKIIKNQFTA